MRVYFPSGASFTVVGEWVGCCSLGGNQSVAISKMRPLDDDGAKRHGALIDPRVCCVDQKTGAILYNPREHMECINEWVKTWLAEHPEWPAILEL